MSGHPRAEDAFERSREGKPRSARSRVGPLMRAPSSTAPRDRTARRPGSNLGCALCAQAAGDPRMDILHRLVGSPGQYRRNALDLEGFVAFPSIGALIDGHVLLVPRRHTRSFAELGDPAATRLAIARLEAKVCSAVGERPVHLFEHGNATHSDRVACSVEHAHIHVVPTEVDPLAFIDAPLEWETLDDEEALATHVAGREYLRYRSPAGGWLVAITDDKPIPSQLLRRAFATALGAGDRWNWRTYPNVSGVRRTLRLLEGPPTAGSLSTLDAT